jgi:hypothetical protein
MKENKMNVATPVELEQEIENINMRSLTRHQERLEAAAVSLAAPAPDLVAKLTRAHPQSPDGEMRHRAAADIARLTEELRLARIEIKALERFCALLSENYDRLLAST